MGTWKWKLRWKTPPPSEDRRFLLLSILIGLFTGLLVVCFHITIDYLYWIALGPNRRGLFVTLLAPPLGATAASALVLLVFRAARGSGVNQTKAAVHLNDGLIPPNTVAGKFLACSISIGTGTSLGPEEPALQMGAGVASLLGQRLRMSLESMRMIAPVGAAAGIAAAFNTPITAVLFVMEEVVAGWRSGVLGSIVLAAVSASVVVRSFLGDEPLFGIPPFRLAHPAELLIYAAIGVAGGALSAVFIKLVFLLRHGLAKLPEWSRFVQPGGAGVLVGVAGIWAPEVMGAGYAAIDSALHDQFPWNMLLMLGLLKILVTLICFSAGIPGGMFAPTLFAGAMIGGGLGALARMYFPFPVSASSAYVLVGMGTFFAGVFRAPMTSIFMVFEVSATYVIIVPVMIANTISYLVSRQFQPTAFFEMLAREEGLALPSPEEILHGRPRPAKDDEAAPAPSSGSGPDGT